jgi:hypothetical protein
MFTNGVLWLRRQDRIMNAMLPADREKIVAGMSDRAAAAGFDERKFWQDVIDFWRPEVGGMTDAALIAKVVRFDDFLNID